MKKLDGFLYVLVCMGTFILASLFEIYALKPLFSFISTSYKFLYILYAIIIIVINPIITYFAGNKIWDLIKEKETS